MEKVEEKIKQEARMNTADLLIKCLEHEGTKYIFGIPGEENLDMMNAIKNLRLNSLQPVMNRAQRLWQMFMEDWLEQQVYVYPRWDPVPQTL